MFARVKEPHVHLRQGGACAERMQPRSIPLCSLQDRMQLSEKRKIPPPPMLNGTGFGMGAFIPSHVFIQSMFSWFGQGNRFRLEYWATDRDFL